MRTYNFIDGLILGIGISAVVLAARWLFDEAHLLERLGVIAIGAILLVLLQALLSRWRIQQANRSVTNNEPERKQPTTPLVSLRTPWSAQRNTNSEPSIMIASDAIAGDPSEDSTLQASRLEGAPEIKHMLESGATKEHSKALESDIPPDSSQEKMV